MFRAALDVDEMLECASGDVGRGNFADPSVVAPLRRLVMACNEEANLSCLGARAARYDIVRCLSNVLGFDELEAGDPTLLSSPVRAPVIITGLPRSGTTFLHRLILQDPSTCAPRLFQLVHPHAHRAGLIARTVRKSCMRLQLMAFRMIARELNALHPIAVDEPEECTDIMAQVFQSLRFDSMYRVPSYNDWLHRAGFLQAYRFHRRFLQHLQWRQPDRRWVLKSPDHVFALDDIRKVYPDAQMVFVHRDPVRVLASVATLTEVLRRPFARSVDRLEIGRDVCAAWIAGARRMMEVSSGSDTVLHLHYRQIIASPLDAVAAVYRHCGLTLTADAQRRMRQWLQGAGRRHRSRREYDLAAFGLEPGLLRERFQRYTDKFQVEAEGDLRRSQIKRSTIEQYQCLTGN